MDYERKQKLTIPMSLVSFNFTKLITAPHIGQQRYL
jgi:hypothetical protein